MQKQRTIKIAFYKKVYGNWKDWLIAKFTRSSYSHVECIFEDGTSWSSSPRDGGVRSIVFSDVFSDSPQISSARKFYDHRWHVKELKLSQIEYNNLRRYFESVDEKGYDWYAIFLFFLKLHSDKHIMCTELIAEGLTFCTRYKKELQKIGRIISPQQLLEAVERV